MVDKELLEYIKKGIILKTIKPAVDKLIEDIINDNNVDTFFKNIMLNYLIEAATKALKEQEVTE